MYGLEAGGKRNEEAILEKFTRRGFDKLSLDDLALIQASKKWGELFEKATGDKWELYQGKTAERLKRGNFDMKWLTKRSDNAATPLLTAIVRNDLQRVMEYFRTHDMRECHKAVDDTNKTCLHLAAKEGHGELVELLISKGWAVDARDRLQTTPLHLACYQGHAAVIQTLLRHNADPKLGDAAGRCAAHYASSAMDPEGLMTLLRADRSSANVVDNAGRGPVHYLVYNNSPRQGEFLRTFFEYNIRIDQTDSAGRTVLHYACEAGRTKCVMQLLKHGARLDLKDSAGKTPVDLVRSDQVHEAIAQYLRPDDRPAFPEPAAPRQTVTPTRSRQGEVISAAKMERRDILHSLLRRIQEAGVSGRQHLKKPMLFSGAWVDGITTPPALLAELGTLSPAEAVLRVFNVLFPYPKALPAAVSDETALLCFYGESAPADTDLAIIDPGDSSPVPVRPPAQDDTRAVDLEAKLATKDRELLKLRQDLRVSELTVDDLKKKVPLMDHLKAMEGERDQAFTIKEKLQKEVISLKQQLEALKAVNEKITGALQTAPKGEELEKLQAELEEKDAKDRALRFKAGILFLKSLDERSEAPAAPTQVHLQDGQVIERLSAAAEKYRPGLKQLLTDVDANADGRVTKAEMTKAMDSLGITPQDTLALLRVAGFRPGVNAVSITAFLRAVETWASKREVLISQLFTKLKDKFKGKSLSDIFSALDVNKDGTISFAEFGEAVTQLKLNMSREERHAVFAVLDGDHCGSISLEELKAQIEVAREPPPPLAEDEEQPIDFNPDSFGESPSKSPTPAAKPTPGPSKSATPGLTRTNKSSTPGLRVTPADNPVLPILNGRLFVQIVKGRDFPPGKFSVQCSLPGSDGPMSTPVMNGPNPEWKFRGRFKVSALKLENVKDVKAELMSGTNAIGATSLQWSNCVSRPGAWAVNGEFPLKDKGGKAKGFALLQLKWVPSDGFKLQGTGTLEIEPTQLTGCGDALVFVRIGENTARTVAPGQKWAEVLRLSDIRLSAAKSVPQLEVQAIDFSSQKVLAQAQCGWESVAATPNQSSGLVKIAMGGNKALTLKMMWIPRSEEEELMHKYATKIQAVWRGKKARDAMKVKKSAVRKLVKRQGVTVEGKYYLVDITEDESQLVAELHPAGDPSQPLYTVLDTLTVAQEEVEGVSVTADERLIVKAESVQPKKPAPPPQSKPTPVRPQPPAKPAVPTVQPKAAKTDASPLRGDLAVRVVSASGLTSVMLKCVVGSAFAHSLAGPPWPRPMQIVNVNTTRDSAKVEITVVEVERRVDVCTVSSEFDVCLDLPNEWSTDVPVRISPSSSLVLQYQWQPYPASRELEDSAAKKLQAAWRGKVARDELTSVKAKPREVVARTGVRTAKGAYYLVSVLKDDEQRLMAELHAVGDPKKPMYTVLDTLPVSAGEESSVSVTPAGKLTVGGDAGTAITGPESKGDLIVKLVRVTGLKDAMVKLVLGSSFAYSLAGPPWSRPLQLSSVVLRGLCGFLDLVVVDVASRSELIRKTVEVSVGADGGWSDEEVVSLRPGVDVGVQYQWLEYPPQKEKEEAAAVKLQAAWRGRQAREEATLLRSEPKELLGRDGLKGSDGHYYLVSFYKDSSSTTAVLNAADDPLRPIYENQDVVRLTTDWESARTAVQVDESGKLRLP